MSDYSDYFKEVLENARNRHSGAEGIWDLIGMVIILTCTVGALTLLGGFIWAVVKLVGFLL